MEIERKVIKVDRVYHLKSGSVPVLKENSGRGLQIWPHQVTLLHEENDTTVIRRAVVEGRDETGEDNMICVGLRHYFYTEPPQWLTQLLTNEGLTWSPMPAGGYRSAATGE